jgi:hypothetical protein
MLAAANRDEATPDFAALLTSHPRSIPQLFSIQPPHSFPLSPFHYLQDAARRPSPNDHRPRLWTRGALPTSHEGQGRLRVRQRLKRGSSYPYTDVGPSREHTKLTVTSRSLVSLLPTYQLRAFPGLTKPRVVSTSAGQASSSLRPTRLSNPSPRRPRPPPKGRSQRAGAYSRW